MKLSKMVIKVALPFVLLAVVLFGCSEGTFEIKKNDEIERNSREQIKLLNDELFKAISSNDLQKVKGLGSPGLLKADSAALKLFIDQVASAYTGSYNVLDQYYVLNSNVGIVNELHSGNASDYDYTIRYNALNRKMYVSLLSFKAYNTKLLLTAVYGKYGSEWKINFLQVGEFGLFEKTSPDYYRLAETNYYKSNLVDALIYGGLAKRYSQPLGGLFRYDKQNEIDDLNDRVVKELNSKYHFPIKLENIKSEPQIFEITTQVLDEGVFPMVHYISRIDLKNSDQLKSEYESVKKEVGRIFPGIDKEKKMVIYWAFNELPEEGKQTIHFGFIDRLVP